MKKKDPEFYIDANLRYRPKNPAQLKKHIEELQSQLEAEKDRVGRVKLKGLIGYYNKCLWNLDDAKILLSEAIDEIRDDEQKLLIQQKVRLGHVLQFRKEFDQSNLLFCDVLEICKKSVDLEVYLPFVLQHSGKNQFDQGNYANALALFQEALQLRKEKKVPQEQIYSSQVAVDKAQELLRGGAGKVILRQLAPADEEAFFEGLAEWPKSDRIWYTFFWNEGMSYETMLGMLARESANVDLQPGWVPATMLYGFVDGRIVGRVNIRHVLNDNLRKRGGNIGYAVAKRYRRNGYATEMVRQSLDYARTLQMSEVMISCASANTPSRKIIEKVGGHLQDEVWDDVDNEMTCRYWVKLDL